MECRRADALAFRSAWARASERDGSALLVWGEELLEWTPAGCAGRRPRSPGPATVLTPRSVAGAIGAGCAPAVHPSHAIG